MPTAVLQISNFKVIHKHLGPTRDLRLTKRFLLGHIETQSPSSPSLFLQCSALCGSGVQHRLIKCVDTKAEVQDEVEQTRCDLQPRPDSTKKCNLNECESAPSGRWYALHKKMHFYVTHKVYFFAYIWKCSDDVQDDVHLKACFYDVSKRACGAMWSYTSSSTCFKLIYCTVRRHFRGDWSSFSFIKIPSIVCFSAAALYVHRLLLVFAGQLYIKINFNSFACYNYFIWWLWRWYRYWVPFIQNLCVCVGGWTNRACRSWIPKSP